VRRDCEGWCEKCEKCVCGCAGCSYGMLSEGTTLRACRLSAKGPCDLLFLLFALRFIFKRERRRILGWQMEWI